ncbi:hypothetical protein [Nocardia transvalensis]|uniref:hypothetical protein n=1 Tax=Nocardia transvalensis TaxID=37333 RepID=UPI001893F980|nr:hypothetical protein [Nocardia transvalensis]MBF6333491.1 hypothetical protein [Nocardia transvalensis]
MSVTFVIGAILLALGAMAHLVAAQFEYRGAPSVSAALRGWVLALWFIGAVMLAIGAVTSPAIGLPLQIALVIGGALLAGTIGFALSRMNPR